MTPSKVTEHLGDIQAHVIRSAQPAAARYYFLNIRDPGNFARWLQQPSVQALVRSEKEIRELKKNKGRFASEQPCFINVAFTFTGLKALGLPEAILAQFPPAFREGMAARAPFIGDYGSDAPECWQDYYGSPHVHVLVALYYLPWLKRGFEPPLNWREEEIQAHDAMLQSIWQSLALQDEARVLMVESAHVIRENRRIREHFGYADGVSQPYVSDGMDMHRGLGGGKKLRADGPWMPLATGEFLLGYWDELQLRNHLEAEEKRREQAQALHRKERKAEEISYDDWLPDATDPTEAAFQRLTRNGSFLVHRKLEQDVAGFRELMKRYGWDSLGTKLVGRDREGRPLVSKHREPLANEFDYRDDPQGEVCPVASHMRRANPRLSLSTNDREGTRRVDQHRLIRRGMPYGPYVPPCDDLPPISDEPRGMHFLCYNTRIDSQFEFVQKNWLNQCDFMGFPTAMVDPIVGNRARDGLGQFCISRNEMPVFGLKQYVHLKGGEYFFSPGLNGLRLLLGLRQTCDPFWRPKQHIEPFDSRCSDPFEVARYVDASQLVAGKRFVKLWVEQDEGKRIPYYYFAHPQDLDSILEQPSLFTTAQYRQRIRALTGADMLLSQPDTPQRQQQKSHTGELLGPDHFETRLKVALQPELEAIRDRFLTDRKLDLVEGLARRLPLAVVKNGFGIAAPPRGADGLYSKVQVAHFFDRTDFASLPSDWKTHYEHYGFSTTADDTLLFWLRMLFLQVFSNVYSVKHIAELAQGAAEEFTPLLDEQIEQRLKRRPGDDVMGQLIRMHRDTFGQTGRDLVVAVRQSVLELAVGSTDTTAKAIAQVVNTLLQFGEDLRAALFNLAGLTAKKLLPQQADQLQPLLGQWLHDPASISGQESVIDHLLDLVAVLCLYHNPVAPLVPRYCLNGATYITSAGEMLNVEPGAVICLLPQVTMQVELLDLLHPNSNPLRDTFPFSNGKYLFMDNTVHACMGRRIALLEIREALKLLLSLPRVRPAAGPSGMMQEKYRLPAGMMLCCG